MFSYCLNNPTNYCDPNGKSGHIAYEPWNCTCSACVTPRVAVVYDERTSGYLFGQFGGKGFEKQAQAQIERLTNYFHVETYGFSDMDEFVSKWNSLSGSFYSIYILSHGTPGAMACAGKDIGNSGCNYSFSDLNHVSACKVYLFCCNGATKNANNQSTADAFSKICGANVLAVSNGSLNYTRIKFEPYATEGGIWITVSAS